MIISEARYMALNIKYEILVNRFKREMKAIHEHSEAAQTALEREIIWLKLQQGKNTPPSHILEVSKRLKTISNNTSLSATKAKASI